MKKNKQKLDHKMFQLVISPAPGFKTHKKRHKTFQKLNTLKIGKFFEKLEPSGGG